MADLLYEEIYISKYFTEKYELWGVANDMLIK